MNALISDEPIPRVLVRPEKQGTFLARHLWVLDRSILPSDPTLASGSTVQLVTPEGRWLATGIYNSASRIRVRLYSWRKDERLDDDF